MAGCRRLSGLWRYDYSNTFTASYCDCTVCVWCCEAGYKIILHKWGLYIFIQHKIGGFQTLKEENILELYFRLEWLLSGWKQFCGWPPVCEAVVVCYVVVAVVLIFFFFHFLVLAFYRHCFREWASSCSDEAATDSQFACFHLTCTTFPLSHTLVHTLFSFSCCYLCCQLRWTMAFKMLSVGFVGQSDYTLPPKITETMKSFCQCDGIIWQ